MKHTKLLLLGLFFLTLAQKAQSFTDIIAPGERTTQEISSSSADNADSTKNIDKSFFGREKKDWTIFLYIQARNNLSPYSVQNLKAATNIGEAPHINFVIQWEQPRQKGVLRYILRGNQLVEVYRNNNEVNITNPLERITAGAKWAIENYPSQRFAFFGWNHGYGGIEIPWGNPLRFVTYSNQQNLMHRVSIPGLAHVSNTLHRGIMFDEEARVYMTTAELVQATANMKKMLGRKVDFVGFDACYMSMADIWCLLADHVEVGVGSSDVELAWGWNYSGIMQELKRQRGITPHELAKIIVSTYRQFYQNKTDIFMLSGIKLSHMDAIKENINQVSQRLCSYMDSFGPPFKYLLIKARKASLDFANPIFTDLRSFYLELYKQLSSINLTRITNANYQQQPTLYHAPGLYSEANDTPEIKELKDLLHTGVARMEEAVIIHTSSQRLSRSSGFGIYFPCRDYYDSYNSGIFSQVSTWPAFIKKFFNMVQEREFSQLV